MRRIIVAAWLAATSLAAAVPAVAESPISMQPLAPGEVLLEVSGLGVSTAPATTASFIVNANGRGETREAAERARDEEVRRLSALARSNGGAGTTIRVIPGTTSDVDSYDEMTMNMSVIDVTESVGGGPPPRFIARSRIEVVLTDPPRAAAVRATLGGGNVYDMGGYDAGGIDYRLADDSAQRRAARAHAIANARANAEAYAASLDMRIVRLLRVTERAGLGFGSMVLTENVDRIPLIDRPGGRINRRDDWTVVTGAVVGVDFALAPR